MYFRSITLQGEVPILSRTRSVHIFALLAERTGFLVLFFFKLELALLFASLLRSRQQ